jgi:heterogeneous nuclear ribonucleoprotein A1/A3
MIMRDKVTGRSRGFAFINFETIDDVDSALSKTTHVIDGRQVEAKRAVPKSEIQARTKKIFVGGVPQAVSDDAFKSHFAKFGEIAESQIMKDRTTGKSRGFGFVTYVSEDSVDRVFQSGAFEIGGKKVRYFHLFLRLWAMRMSSRPTGFFLLFPAGTTLRFPSFRDQPQRALLGA